MDGVILHACCYISLQFLPFFIYSMVTYYPILFIVWLLITLMFIQYCIVRECLTFLWYFITSLFLLTGHCSDLVITALSLSLSCSWRLQLYIIWSTVCSPLLRSTKGLMVAGSVIILRYKQKYLFNVFLPSLDRPSGSRLPNRWGFKITLIHTTLGRTRVDE
jgi:hypothetical protein